MWFPLAIFEPVVRESTPSIIAGKLRTAIGRGQIPAGSQLVETELARELGVSRGPLREAMQRLTQEGYEFGAAVHYHGMASFFFHR